MHIYSYLIKIKWPLPTFITTTMLTVDVITVIESITIVLILPLVLEAHS